MYRLLVAFGNHRVVVYSSVIEISIWLKNRFQEMIIDEFSDQGATLTMKAEVYKNLATYYLLVEGEVLIADNSLNKILTYLSRKIILYFIQASSNILWLHAGAVIYQKRAILLSGIGGRGKSTLVTNLCRQYGWNYLSDDILPLNLTSDHVMPFPQTPAVRKNTGMELPPYRIAEIEKQNIPLDSGNISKQAAPIGTLIFPEYRPHIKTEILPHSPSIAVLELLQNCLNLVNYKETGVSYLCTLLKQVPAFYLPYSDSQLATELIVQTLQKVKW